MQEHDVDLTQWSDFLISFLNTLLHLTGERPVTAVNELFVSPNDGNQTEALVE